MSRYTIRKGNLEISYGSDHIGEAPGYFFQVFDLDKVTEDSEGMVVNEGFLDGINSTRMMQLMKEYDIEAGDSLRLQEHMMAISNNQPI